MSNLVEPIQSSERVLLQVTFQYSSMMLSSTWSNCVFVSRVTSIKDETGLRRRCKWKNVKTSGTPAQAQTRWWRRGPTRRRARRLRLLGGGLVEEEEEPDTETRWGTRAANWSVPSSQSVRRLQRYWERRFAGHEQLSATFNVMTVNDIAPALLGKLRVKGCASASFFVQTNPPFRDQQFSFTGHFIANPARTATKKREGHSAEMQKHEHTTVLNRQKRAICVFKCWLNCQVASFEGLLSLEKTIDDPTPSWSAVLRLVPQ